MPTYEYQCERCKKGFEMYQSMKDEPLAVCPKEHCRMKTWGKGKIKRQLGTGAGLIFKGSGFYITDYRSEKYKSAAQKDSASATASSSSSSGEAKPAGDTAKKAEPKPAAPEKKSKSGGKSE